MLLPFNRQIIQSEFSPTWSCVSLTRSTTSSDWKLFRFDKMEVNCFQILLIHVTFLNMFKRWYLTSWVPGLLCSPVPRHVRPTQEVLGKTIFHVNYLSPHLMGPHLAINWLGLLVRLYRGTTPRSCQGHVEVIWRSNKLKYWIKHIFYSYLLQRSFPQDCSWHIVAGKPSNTHPRGYSEYYVAWRGNTPLLYPPSPLISRPPPTLNQCKQ